jgi:hypothetical protein
MATSADALASKTEAELLFISQHPEKHSPEVVAAAERELQQRLDAVNSSYNAASSSRMGPLFIGLALLLLVGVGVFWYQRQSPESVAQPTGKASSTDSLKLETVVATPLPKFDVESPILRQLALLPPAERVVPGPTMALYQRLTRRFWLAENSTEYLLKQAQTGKPNLPVFAQQLATVQAHWQVLSEGLNRGEKFPPVMTDHLNRMKEVKNYQQTALSELQASTANQHQPQLAAPTLVAEQKVKKLLAPLLRAPGTMTVHLH